MRVLWLLAKGVEYMWVELVHKAESKWAGPVTTKSAANKRSGFRGRVESKWAWLALEAESKWTGLVLGAESKWVWLVLEAESKWAWLALEAESKWAWLTLEAESKWVWLVLEAECWWEWLGIRAEFVADDVMECLGLYCDGVYHLCCVAFNCFVAKKANREHGQKNTDDLDDTVGCYCCYNCCTIHGSDDDDDDCPEYTYGINASHGPNRRDCDDDDDDVGEGMRERDRGGVISASGVRVGSLRGVSAGRVYDSTDRDTAIVSARSNDTMLTTLTENTIGKSPLGIHHVTRIVDSPPKS